SNQDGVTHKRSRNWSLRFFGLITNARTLPAAWAAAAVLGLGGGLQIDADDVGQRQQPGEHIGKFFLTLAGRATPKCARQLAHLLHEPHKRTFHPTTAVLDVIGGMDDLLQLRDRKSHLTRSLARVKRLKWRS